jgi:hypothetical protein
VDFSIWLNASGISLEIIGFIVLLIAVKQMPPKGGSFTSDWDYLGNVMSTRHPRVNAFGILLVIIGLGIQLSALFV